MKETVDRVVALLTEFEQEFHMPPDFEEKGDEYDVIRNKLTEISRLARQYRERSERYQKRVEALLNVLLRYAIFDFSVKAEVSELGDEIDAIAVGLNTLGDELQVARETEARQIETIREKSEQVETIMANAPSAVVVMGSDDKIIRWNARAQQMFGFTPEEAIGSRVADLIVPERLREAHLKGMARYLKTGEGPILNHMVEMVAVSKSGEEIPIELGVSTVRSGGRELFIGFLNDISERRSSEEKIRATNVQLESSNKELESFSYSVSHDLRAPLRAINGYTQILMKEYGVKLDDRGTMMMNAVLTNVKKMAQLIDDLLSLSRFGRAELKRKKIDMRRLVENAWQEVSRSFDLSNVKFEIGQLPEPQADAVLLTQVMVNLLSNAVKYSAREPHPVVEVGYDDKQEAYFVKDNGTGFEMKFYDKLFGVFQRLHDHSEYEGTGVGLAIVKRIVDRHDGRIWAVSEPGKGATFYFSID